MEVKDAKRVKDNVAYSGFGIRHVQAGVMAVAAFVAYSNRISLSVAIVAMVRYKNENQTTPYEELSLTFDWNEETQGYILSSFFWGYMILQIPAGIITEKFGGHQFLCFAVIGSSLLTVLIPPSAFIGTWYLVCLNRMCQGMCQCFLFPSVYTLLGLWCPVTETSSMTSIALGATFLGMVVTTPISGYLVKLYGWPTVFYTFGGIGIALGVVMMILGADAPAKHRWISEKEKRFIENSRGGAKVQRSVPWKDVLTSAPYLAALLNMACYTLGYFLFLAKIPTYLATVLKFSIEDNGLLTALPYLVALILSFIFSGACDFFVNRKYLSLTAARKLLNSIAHFGSGAAIIFMAYVRDRTLSVVLLCALMGCQAASIIGVQANFVDLAPNFAGPIYGVANFMSAVFGLVGPLLVGFIVTEAGSVEQWRIVFFMCALVLVLSNCVFLFWGSAETQWWNWSKRCSGERDMKESGIKSTEFQKRSVPVLSSIT